MTIKKSNRGETFHKISFTILTASDLNAKYLSCIPYFIEFWLSFGRNANFKIQPRVLLVADKLPDNLLQFERYIELVTNEDDLSSAYVAQGIRLFWPAFEQSEFVLITDVDMLPMSDRILHNSLKNIRSANDFIIYRDILTNNEYPICYNIASPNVWGSLMWNTEPMMKNLNLLRVELLERGGSSAYSGEHGGAGWTIDQELLWKKVQSSRDINFIKLKKDHVFFKRLDRSRHNHIFKWLCLPLIFFNVFDDYHVHHPVQKNKVYIGAALHILKAKNGLFYFFKVCKYHTSKDDFIVP